MRREKGPIICLGIIVIDQLAKNLFQQKGLALVNQDLGWNILPFDLKFWGVSLLILSLTLVGYYRFRRLSLLLIFAGGLSNLIDRLVWGGVVDFIFWQLPAFNLADLVIGLGISFLLVDFFKKRTIS